MDERSRHRQFEDQFHRQLRTRAENLVRGALPADRVIIEPMPDGLDAIRDTLNRLERYERRLLDELPGTRAVQMRFRRAMLGGLFSRSVGRVRGLVLAPTEDLLEQQAPGPISREQVLDALARYELLPQRERPDVVILAGADGFSAPARELANTGRRPALILVGGREDGGWDVEMPERLRRSPWAKLTEFETQDDRLRRLQYHLEKNADLLDSRGVSLEELADEIGLSPAETERLVRRACRADSRLLTVDHDGRVHLCRSPLAAEMNAMSLWSRIRKLLRLKPTTAERVRELTAQRVALEQQREEFDRKVSTLETEEREALQRGARAASEAEKKQVAGRLVRIRRDLRRARAQAQVFTQQIDIIGTHLHNLTLAEQGRRVSLPTAEDLTQEAAQAEQIVSEVAANADLAASIEVGAQTPMGEDEEAAIFAEFEQVAASAPAREPTTEEKPAASEPPERTERAQPAEHAGNSERAGPDHGPPPPPKKEKESPRPETG